MQQRKFQPLGKILGSIAQDYNGLLAQIEGHAHMMDRQSDENALQSSSIKAIIAAVEQGSTLTRRLIQLSEFPADPAGRTDLVSALRRNQVLLRPILGSGAEIELNLPAGEIYISLCEEGVTQILISAVLDARRRHAGRLSLSVSLADRKALLHISDNGIEGVGLLRGSSLARSGRGGGNGAFNETLSSEWQMIKEWALTGSGVMTSTLHETQGGDVMLAFPLGIQSANPFANKTVLVVDNGEGLPDLVETHLHAFGVRVLKAANAEQALVLQKQQPQIDVLLTDPMMPELNGVKLAQMLVEDNPQLRVVYVTGNEGEPVDQEMAALLKSAITMPLPLSLRGLSCSLERALQMVEGLEDPLDPTA